MVDATATVKALATKPQFTPSPVVSASTRLLQQRSERRSDVLGSARHVCHCAVGDTDRLNTRRGDLLHGEDCNEVHLGADLQEAD